MAALKAPWVIKPQVLIKRLKGGLRPLVRKRNGGLNEGFVITFDP
ncbi:MAG: hypothetical protein ABIQ31_18445 [Ferruginibacter sp.]